MNKYIDAEKLIAEIEQLKEADKTSKKHVSEYVQGGIYGFDLAVEKTIAIITSLQQEQESVAERFARTVRGNLTGIDKEVQQKFEQLYFEVTGNKMYGGYND